MDSVSKQTVKNLVHDTVIELSIQEQEEKKESGTCISKQMRIMLQPSFLRRRGI